MTKSDRIPHAELARQSCPTKTLEGVGNTQARDHGNYRPPADEQRDLPVQLPQTLDSLRSKVEREEQAGNVLRMRQAALTALLMWPSFLVFDWVMVTYAHAGSLSAYVAIRSAVSVSIFVGYLLVRGVTLPSATVLLASELFVFGGASIGVSFMCLLEDGLVSPYAAGIPAIFTVRAAFLAVPWRAALGSTMFCALAYPFVVLGSATASGDLAELFSSSDKLGIFALYNAMIWATLIATLVGGHTTWALRRQTFEARSVGRYRLVRQLARGGMGEVWLAHHTTLHRDVALKLLRSDRLSEVALRRFEREVQATTELTHPHTVRVFDYGATDDGLWYYAMELLQGEDLASAVQRGGPLPPRRALQLIMQVAGALAEAHAHGIVHRDIKPENIFLCRAAGVQDFVKVLDFGIAKREDGDQAVSITNTDRPLGTLAYLSPEVALGGSADLRTDVYALGGLLYFMLVGSAPFEGVPTSELVEAHVSKEPEPPSARLGTPLDPRLEQVVMRCLAKEPAARFADAGELLRALEDLS